jgi:hypothetical protein
MTKLEMDSVVVLFLNLHRMSRFIRATACALLSLCCSISQSQSQGEPAIQSGLSIESYVADLLILLGEFGTTCP